MAWLEDYLGISIEDLANKSQVEEYGKSEATWNDFRDVLVRNSGSILKVDLPGYEVEQPVKEGFDASRTTLRPLLERIQFIDLIIDQIVYRLYGLKDEDVLNIER